MFWDFSETKKVHNEIDIILLKIEINGLELAHFEDFSFIVQAIPAITMRVPIVRTCLAGRMLS